MSTPTKTTQPARKASGESTRRRSSSSGMFAGMYDYKRDSAAHATRRQSIKDQTVGGGGLLSSIFNSTFKGDTK